MDSDKRRSNAMGMQVQTISPAELYEVIIKASSQDFAELQTSSRRLKQLLDLFGAYDALQEIAARRELQLSVRQQAIIQFKNAVTNHWRSRKLLSDEHRARIRQRCLTFMDEMDDTIVECNEVVVAKLARTDYPSLWPNLLDDLVQVIDFHWQARYTSGKQNSLDVLKLQRGLELLNAILKEFASIKLPNGMKTMGQITERLRLPLFNYYARMSVTFSAGSITQDNISLRTTYDNIALSHLVFKCLVKIGVWLWNKLEKLTAEEYEAKFPWLQDLFQNSLSQLKSLIMLRKSIILTLGPIESEWTRRTIVTLSKHLRVFGKFFRRCQQLSPERFISLPMSAELILFYWSEIIGTINYPPKNVADSDEAMFPVRLVVQGLILFKDSLSQWSPVRRSGVPNENALSKEFVENAVQLLVSRFMLLNTSDLENWLMDPEDWVHSEDKESDQWEYEIRACSERVITQLSNYFPLFVIPLIADTFQKIAPTLPTDIEGIVQREALYCAVGRCARSLKNVIDFETALETIFVVEVHEINPDYTIIKRRIAWLVGKWVSEECSTPNHPKIWDVLSYLLCHEANAVVRLTAAAALRDCVNSLAFEPTSFAPFLTSTVPPLIQLIGDVETLESKRKVDECLNIVIERSGPLILPFMALITSPIPQLWVAAEKDLLFKGSLLVTVTKLVEAVKEHSSSLSALIVPLIKDSLAPENIVYLDADGLNLWIAALRNSETIVSDDGSPCLRDLFPEALQLLATNLDLLGSITKIVESYFLLDAFFILQSQSVDLFRAFLSTFRNKIIDINAKQLLQSLGILVQLAPSNLWGEAMHTSGLFPELLKTLIAEECSTLLLTEYIYLFSRMLLNDSHMFLQLMAASAPVLGQTETTLFSMLIGVWWEKFDNMSEPRHRKLTALATAVLVSTGRREILEKLSTDIFNMWLDVFGELKEVDERREDVDLEWSESSLIRFWDQNEPPDSYYQGSEGTPEYSRRKTLYKNDPAQTTPLIPFICAELQQAETICGPEFQTYMQDADHTVLQQIQSFLATSN